MVGQPLFPDELVGALSITEVAWGADLTASPSSWTWSEVIPLQNPGIQYSIGKQQENNVAPPAQFTFTLDNRDNSTTQYSPLCTNWPNVREGTPARQRVIIGGVSYTLIQGRIIGFKPAFDSTGKWATTVITVAGRLRVDSGIKIPVKSPLYRAILAATTPPIHYIPLEGAAGTLNAPSVLPNDTAMLTQNPSASVGVTWAAFTPEFVEPPYYVRWGTDSLPDLSKGASLVGNIATTHASGWGIQFVCQYDATSNTSTASMNICELHTADGRVWRLYQASSGPMFGTTLTVATSVTGVETTVLNYNFLATALQEMTLQFVQSGSDISVKFITYGTLATTATVTGVTLTNLQWIGFNVNRSLSSVIFAIGHLQVYDTNVFSQFSTTNILASSAMTSWTPETALTRLTRICAEDGIQFSTIGYYADNTIMGPQFPDNIYNLLNECEQTLNGVKYDGLNDGVVFMGPSQRYDQFSQFTIDGTAGEIIPPLEPLPDDFIRCNRMIVTRRNGATDAYEDDDPTHELSTVNVGTYERTLTPQPNYYDDSGLINRARWEVHKGTVPGFRWPSVSINVRKIASKAADIAGMLPGYMFTMKVPLHWQPQIPPDDIPLIAEGWSGLLIPPYRWELTFNCSLQDVYQVWKIGDPLLGRIGTDGHTLAVSASAGASSLSLTTPAGKQLWTTTGPFPIYLRIDGIKVKVTAISGSSSPQTATVDSTTVTKALTSGKPVTIWKNGVIAL